jgi:sialic acid synthase SpsE
MKKRVPLVIAEAGVNHNGDLGRAREMVRAAAEAGADYVKFQAFHAETLVSRRAARAAYQKKNAGAGDQLSLLRALELSLDDFAVLAKECRRARVGFLVTPFDGAMAAPLIAMGMDRIKIPSGELTNEPMLRDLARLRLPILLSTGMATKAEVGRALSTLRRAGAQDITLLHCTSLYPAPVASINLRADRDHAPRLRRARWLFRPQPGRPCRGRGGGARRRRDREAFHPRSCPARPRPQSIAGARGARSHDRALARNGDGVG